MWEIGLQTSRRTNQTLTKYCGIAVVAAVRKEIGLQNTMDSTINYHLEYGKNNCLARDDCGSFSPHVL